MTENCPRLSVRHPGASCPYRRPCPIHDGLPVLSRVTMDVTLPGGHVPTGTPKTDAEKRADDGDLQGALALLLPLKSKAVS